MHSLCVCTGHQAAGRAPSRGKPCGFVCKNASAAEAVCLSLGVEIICLFLLASLSTENFRLGCTSGIPSCLRILGQHVKIELASGHANMARTEAFWPQQALCMA